LIAMGIIRTAAVAAVIIGAGLVSGAWTNRWRPSPEMAALAARFDSVPMTIGDWTAKPFELGPYERRWAGAEAALTRIYTNPARGYSVSVSLFGGLSRKISVDTPDGCTAVRGYDVSTPTAYEFRYGSDGRRAGFRTATGIRRGANPDAARLLWTWHTPAGWVAPEDALRAFALERTLCKLCVICKGGEVVDPDRDPRDEFLHVFLPVLDRTVFAAPG